MQNALVDCFSGNDEEDRKRQDQSINDRVDPIEWAEDRQYLQCRANLDKIDLAIVEMMERVGQP